ncbi:MAG: hypothetical protein C0407_02450 [Desulfobacca sp.]|nr:hypothetical protein [Desulfobacca sp.]
MPLNGMNALFGKKVIWPIKESQEKKATFSVSQNISVFYGVILNTQYLPGLTITGLTIYFYL